MHFIKKIRVSNRIMEFIKSFITIFLIFIVSFSIVSYFFSIFLGLFLFFFTSEGLAVSSLYLQNLPFTLFFLERCVPIRTMTLRTHSRIINSFYPFVTTSQTFILFHSYPLTMILSS